MLLSIFALLILFQFKHFLCDYIWQTSYMLGKFKESGWVEPLLAHVCVHGAATFTIAFFFVGGLASGLFFYCILLMLLDMAIHFAMDRIKASPKMLGRFNTQQKEFWWSLGLDQMVHHLTHYALIYLIVTV